MWTFGVNKTGLIAKISIKYVLPICIWKYFWRISRYFAYLGEFRGISQKYLNFADPRPREISEALNSTKDFVNKSAKAKNNYNRWLQCTVYIDDTIIFTPWLWSFTTPVALPIFFQLLTQEMFILFFFLGRLFTHYNIKWAKGVLLQPK